MASFSERLKATRKAAGLSQEAAAQALDIRYSTYRRYEQGGTEPTVSNAARIADFSLSPWTIWRGTAME